MRVPAARNVRTETTMDEVIDMTGSTWTKHDIAAVSNVDTWQAALRERDAALYELQAIRSLWRQRKVALNLVRRMWGRGLVALACEIRAAEIGRQEAVEASTRADRYASGVEGRPFVVVIPRTLYAVMKAHGQLHGILAQSVDDFDRVCVSAHIETGYRYCSCRDCMEITVGEDLCDGCSEAGCLTPEEAVGVFHMSAECQSDHSYGGD